MTPDEAKFEDEVVQHNETRTDVTAPASDSTRCRVKIAAPPSPAGHRTDAGLSRASLDRYLACLLTALGLQ